MQKHERTGKRLLALVLALVMALSTVTECLAAVVERPVTAGGKETVTAGELVAKAYTDKLTDAEKALLESGLLTGETYTYTAPASQDELVTVDETALTITAKSFTKDGFTWLPEGARIVVDSTTNEPVELKKNGQDYVGSFSEAGNTYSVEVDYAAVISVSTDTQNLLLNTPYMLAKGLENIETLNSQSGASDLLEQYFDALYKLRTEGMDFAGTHVDIVGAAAAAIDDMKAQIDRNGGNLDISVELNKYAAYEEGKTAYLVKEGATMKAVAEQYYKEMPNSLKGVFEDAEGRNVMVTFKLDKGVWKGTATFNTSGIFTMKYVSLDGEFYEVQESLQPTLELLLGLKTSTSISASADTLAKLQTVKADALPTRFVFDKAKLGAESVTLNVSTRIYDNSGNEIRELTGVNLYYGKAGSDKDGLDAVLVWNEATEGYTGDFLITTAGTYSFTKVTVKADGKTNDIKAATSAPNIQVMPPDDVSYYGSTTDAYQFCPNKDGVVSVELAYSNAASNITATLKNQAGKRIVVENTAEDETQVIMGETTERDGKTVTEWIFAIPDTTDVSQEGEWSLEAITLYGVYYNKLYYGEEGVTIDLSAEHIQTKVVNYVRVTLAGTSHAGGNAFAGTFMTDHPVDDMTVTIEDYEHEPIQAEIGAVKVAYRLNSDKVSMDTYGYTASNLSTGVIVDAVGSSRQNDATVYDIGTLNFQQAGPYETCAVTFTLNGEPYTASTAQGAKAPLQYRDGERASEMCPQFEVKWSAPDVQLFYIKQHYWVDDGSCNGQIKYKEFSQTQIATIQNPVLNKSLYEASVWWQRDNSNWYYPQIKIVLKNLDSTYFQNSTVDVVFVGTLGKAIGTTHTKTYTFDQKTGQSTAMPYGKIEGDSGDDAGYGLRGNDQWRGTPHTIDTLKITMGATEYQLSVQQAITIKLSTKENNDKGAVTW